MSEDLATVSRLLKASTGEYYSSPSTARKLSNLVAHHPNVDLSKAQINRIFHILRRHNSFTADSPRMSSLPPTPEYKKDGEYSTHKGLTSSKSFQELPRYVVHEDVDCNIEIVYKSNEDLASLSSQSTLETVLDSDRRGSTPSMDSTASTSAGPSQGAANTADVIVDMAGYVSREWRGDTDKARLIRNVSKSTVFLLPSYYYVVCLR